MKRYWSRLLALVLVVTMGLMGCSSSSSLGLSGDYRQDTLALLQGLRTAIELPEGSADKAAAQSQARQIINDFASRYRRDSSVAKLSSYTTMRTALNSIAGHYSSYPNRPLPEKLKTRLEQEFQQVEAALRREA
ncbi:photosystem II protein Psb27 [Coleofasciculus sp. FACHB-64]|uniref:photosystem II protein Psb27 n=2 Tax=Cyanobacteriota TaxID=1117 RepID=UPI001685E1AF|nr:MULTISPECIES: photosystem II protein Psb27 [unclassified Coleofasciculus]MBD1837841.1 photosystem II protein Psb27 [Coleofasciculus sp. FACHB-501]MBD1879567.1 photosystem II protein Psb27 [Coleofasciculus sp. FACHB-T130]MBD1890380.1 photosystem II protein Psb27 [Coleofasciculus sp. FACHB-SPT9]MBD1893275.1 photosystem II protein Psb27 [Coleofasciculus sp. FACHB-129]MBD1902794.1 photosystem II protein Psb27 [Coleofasciculus sp. FACHB-125]